MSLIDANHPAIEAARTAPPITVAGAAFMGASLQDWVYIITIAYTLWQFGISIRRFVRERKNTPIK